MARSRKIMRDVQRSKLGFVRFDFFDFSGALLVVQRETQSKNSSRENSSAGSKNV